LELSHETNRQTVDSWARESLNDVMENQYFENEQVHKLSKQLWWHVS
jgi:hypothetical protein